LGFTVRARFSSLKLSKFREVSLVQRQKIFTDAKKAIRDGFTPSKNKCNPIESKMEMSACMLLQAKWFGDYFGQELKDGLMVLKKAIEETMDLSFIEGLYFSFCFSVERAVRV
jgi:hypothetical protein